jgi:hypothetical protein
MDDIVMVDAESTSDILTPCSYTAPLPPILRLPLELRERIFYFALKQDRPISWPHSEERNIPVSLLRTCKKIYQQASVTLYEQNVLLFRHPSDCNMFLYSFNPELVHECRRLLFHITDREVALWTNYLSSSHTYRSLLHDYPHLEEVYIVLRSSISLGSPHHNLLEAYKKWKTSKALINLCRGLKSQDHSFTTKVLFVRFASRNDTEVLLRECADHFDIHPKKTPGPRLRTYWETMENCKIALDATVDNNPWITGELF